MKAQKWDCPATGPLPSTDAHRSGPASRAPGSSRGGHNVQRPPTGARAAGARASERLLHASARAASGALLGASAPQLGCPGAPLSGRFAGGRATRGTQAAAEVAGAAAGRAWQPSLAAKEHVGDVGEVQAQLRALPGALLEFRPEATRRAGLYNFKEDCQVLQELSRPAVHGKVRIVVAIWISKVRSKVEDRHEDQGGSEEEQRREHGH
mmetsp:Transcript_18043/g.49798  ORF Transcript_18043/g.49798 Transcript_18043/m.49798 type:complete len:209 (+) Transcript_18043:37-663(+)